MDINLMAKFYNQAPEARDQKSKPQKNPTRPVSLASGGALGDPDGARFVAGHQLLTDSD